MVNRYRILSLYSRIGTDDELPDLVQDTSEIITLLEETYMDWEIINDLNKNRTANNLVKT